MRQTVVVLLSLALMCGATSPAVAGSRFVRRVDWAGRGVWLKADTHVHTLFSDGARSVSQVAAKASEFGCDVLAITDHGDRQLGAGSREYVESISAARREFPQLVVLAGIEWNVPPWDGAEHVVVLFPPGANEGRQLAEFKARFDNLDREEHSPLLADAGLEWLARLPTERVAPVAIYEHPARRGNGTDQVVSELRHWRAVNDVIVGFSGAPGHQALQPLGAYRTAVQPVDRWDPSAAEVGGAWDRLLEQGIDVWAASATSDFHDDRHESLGDYWPGQFSETWLYAPERSAVGALQALQAGTFFGVHGQIAREVELRVTTPDLSRAAVVGETIEVSPGTELAVELSLVAAAVDWAGQPSRIDQLELIGITSTGTEILARLAPGDSGPTRLLSQSSPPTGIVFRARGRRIVEDGPDLMFYTNSIRVITRDRTADDAALAMPDVSRSELSLLQLSLQPAALVSFGSVAVAAAMLLLVLAARTRPGGLAETPILEYFRAPSAPSEIGLPALAAAGRRTRYVWASLGFIAFTVYGSWVPLDFRPVGWTDAAARFNAVLRSPLSMQLPTDWAVNFLLALPIGFCSLGACILGRRGWPLRIAAGAAVVFFCAMLSTAVEFSQIWFPVRSASLNDIAAQTLGGAAGVALWLSLGETFESWLRYFAAGRKARRPFARLLEIYLLGLALYSVFPLVAIIGPSELWLKYRAGVFHTSSFWHWEPSFESFYALAGEVLLFVPVGMLATTGVRLAESLVRSLLRSLLMGLTIATAIELAKTLAYGRAFDLERLLPAAAGIVWGAAWRLHRLQDSQRFSPLATNRWRIAIFYGLAIACYAVFLAGFFLAPFASLDDPESIRRRWLGFFDAPWTAWKSSQEFNAATQILQKGLLFAPIGYFAARAIALGMSSGRARLGAAAVISSASFVLAYLIEYCQIYRLRTTASFADVALSTLGVIAASTLTLWLEPQHQQYHAGRSDSPITGESERRDAGRMPLAASGWLLLAVGLLLLAIGLGLRWADVGPHGASELPADTRAASRTSRASSARFATNACAADCATGSLKGSWEDLVFDARGLFKGGADAPQPRDGHQKSFNCDRAWL